MTFKPFIKDGELWGKEVNPIGERPVSMLIGKTMAIRNPLFDEWKKAEQQLKEFKVNEGEYERSGETRFWTTPSALGRFRNQLLQMPDTFTAEMNNNNELINLRVL